MGNWNKKAEGIMKERFGRDSVISLATAVSGTPYVRPVNAYYKGGSFYVITYALSRKMDQIKENDIVAISGEWFSGHGRAMLRRASGFFSHKRAKDHRFETV